MSILFMDFPSGGQGLYGTNTAYMLNGLYAGLDGTVSLVEDPDPNITGNVIKVVSNGPFLRGVRKVFASSVTTLGFANRFWATQLPSNTNFPAVQSLAPAWEWRDGSNSTIVQIYVDTTGSLVAYRGSVLAGGVLLATSNPCIITGAFQHIEMKLFSDAVTGTIDIRVDSVTVLSFTGNTGGAPIAQFKYGVLNNGAADPGYWYWKDTIWWDTTGAYNNDFMGSVSVKELIPDGDVALNWALTGSVTGYGAVNEAPPDDDTKYIYAVTPAPAADLMSLTDLPVDVTSVRGLMIINRSKNTDGGDGKLQMGLVSGASTQLYTDRQITTAYTYWTDISETDPATAAAWLPGAVNAMNLRFNRTL